MCGITGILNLTHPGNIEEINLRQMLALLRHRGPDQFGIYIDDWVGLGSARLNIIDLSSGQQPICNEDGTLWIVFNGEIFNYVELRPQLEARGHSFSTNTDTEVILHLYEDIGPDCLNLLNGQFSIAIWDTRKQALFLARDRLGIRPLFYTITDGALIFGSEIKAILADPRVKAEFDPVSLDQIFTFWSTLTPRTVFRSIFEVSPGHYLYASNGSVRVKQYWQITFPGLDNYPEDVGLLTGSGTRSAERATQYLDEFRNLLVDAACIRLRADVPVGAYLSGGLDSSTTTAIIRNYTRNSLETFSIAFSDPGFDESVYQRQMADYLGTNHHVVFTRHSDIGEVFPEVIWHTETPILRTSPAPMFLLSRLVHDHGLKVVLTGEGADEFLGGYEIFKEARIRHFWSRQPASKHRPRLLEQLYPDIASLPNSHSYLASFFGEGLLDTDSPAYSHEIRWRTTRRCKRFFSEGLHENIQQQAENTRQAIFYPEGFSSWDPLSRAQYLESTIFLSQYLLSSQGDRMGMAHSVEGRFPFLDYRVVEFANRLPPHLKMFGLNEKYLLKKLARQWLPDEISSRPKRPYRAPIHKSFFNQESYPYVRELLSPQYLRAAGMFNGQAVGQLVQKLDAGKQLSETDDMALAGILSSQLVYHHFVDNFRMPEPLSTNDDVKVCIAKSINGESDEF
jgi:asparagine synthase (glutamine-hydrolysing)